MAAKTSFPSRPNIRVIVTLRDGKEYDSLQADAVSYQWAIGTVISLAMSHYEVDIEEVRMVRAYYIQ